MTESPFYTFIHYIQTDQELEKHKSDYKNIQIVSQKQVLDIQTLQEELAHKQKAVHDLKKKLDGQELENKTLRDQLISKKKRLEITQSPREYQSLHQEIEQLQKKEAEQEDLLMDLLLWYEQAKDALSLLQPQMEETIKQLKEIQSKNQLLVSSLQEKIIEQEKVQKEQMPLLRAEWFERYEMMKARVSNPVVPVKNGACSGCYYAISPADLQALRKHVLVHCKDCYRLLYIL